MKNENKNEYQGKIVKVYEYPEYPGVKVHINDKHIFGKTREQILEEVNKRGPYKITYEGDEKNDEPKTEIGDQARVNHT